MSSVSIFTSVKYNNNLENPPVTGWCAKQLDRWAFPFFGSKIEVIKFDENNASDLKVARYQEDKTSSSILGLVVRILLLATVIFPLIVLIARANIRHNIEFKKIEQSKDVPSPHLTTPSETDQNDISSQDKIQQRVIEPTPVPLSPLLTTPSEIIHGDIRLSYINDSYKSTNEEIQVPLDKSFSIELFYSVSTGHKPWKISETPSFIDCVCENVVPQPQPPDACGGGNYYVFVFKLKESGKGNIVMQLPCFFDDRRTVNKVFTIIAE